jgi:hypothetical protein
MGIGIDIVGWIVILPLALVLTPRAIELYWVYYFCERKNTQLQISKQQNVYLRMFTVRT